MADDFNCSICREFTSDDCNDYFVCTEGGHIFHYSCVQKLLKNGHTRCPLCRESIQLANLTRLYGVEPKKKLVPVSSVCSSPPSPKQSLKIVLLGDSGVGKTCLLNKFVYNSYNADVKSTIGCDMLQKTIDFGGTHIRLILWDTCGQEKYQSLARSYVRNVDGIFLVYDITNGPSVSSLHYWMQFARQHAPSDCIKILIGNKSDLLTTSALEKMRQGPELAERLNLTFLRTSAKEASTTEAEAVLRTMTAEILQSRLEKENLSEPPITSSSTPSNYYNSFRIRGANNGLDSPFLRRSHCC